MRTSARCWDCRLAFPESQGPIPRSTNVRMPLFWQRPSNGWRPIRNARTRHLTSPIAILSGGRTYGPSSPISSGWSWLRHDTSILRGPWPTRVRYGDRIVEKNGLQKHRFEEIAAWGYPDGVFASDYDIVSDTSKARRFGFHELVDTEEMFLRMFSDFRRDRIIP